MQTTLLQALRDVHRRAATRDLMQRVLPAVPHGRGRGHGRRQEGLHLVGAEAVRLKPQGQFEHVLVRRARMGRDEVRNKVLLLTRLLRELVEQLLELVVRSHAGLHHLRQRAFAEGLRRNLQIAAHVVLGQLLHVLGAFDGEVIAHTRSHQHLLDAGQLARLAVKLDERAVVRVQVRADAREHARRLAASRLNLARLAGDAVHVGRGATEVRDNTREARHRIANLPNLLQHRLLGTVLNDAAFVFCDGAEGTATKAATLDGHGEPDHLVRGNLLLAVKRVRHALVRQFVNAVHFLRRQRNGRRVQPHIGIAMALHQRARIARVRLGVQHTARVGIQHRVVFHGFKRRQTNDAVVAVGALDARALQRSYGYGSDNAIRIGRGHAVGTSAGAIVDRLATRSRKHIGRGQRALAFVFHGIRVDGRRQRARLVERGGIQFRPAFRHCAHGRAAFQERRAANIGELSNRLALGKTVGDLHHLAFAVAEDEQVRLAVEQHRPANFFGPVVEVRDATQRRFDTTDDERGIGKRFTSTLCVNDDGTVRPFAALAVRRVRVVAAHATVRRVAVHHRVHVAGGDAEEQVRAAKLRERIGTAPVRLSKNANAETLGFQQAPHERHAEAGVVDVGIAGDQDDVAGIPAEQVHLRAGNGQEGGNAKAGSPELAVGEQPGGCWHGGGRRSFHPTIVRGRDGSVRLLAANCGICGRLLTADG